LIHFYKRDNVVLVMSVGSVLADMSWKWLLGGAITGMLTYANLPSAWILPQQRATEDYLANAKLLTLPQGDPIDARSLWKENGAVIMAVRRPG